jgi:hypothetical protein
MGVTVLDKFPCSLIRFVMIGLQQTFCLPLQLETKLL